MSNFYRVYIDPKENIFTGTKEALLFLGLPAGSEFEFEDWDGDDDVYEIYSPTPIDELLNGHPAVIEWVTEE